MNLQDFCLLMLPEEEFKMNRRLMIDITLYLQRQIYITVIPVRLTRCSSILTRKQNIGLIKCTSPPFDTPITRISYLIKSMRKNTLHIIMKFLNLFLKTRIGILTRKVQTFITNTYIWSCLRQRFIITLCIPNTFSNLLFPSSMALLLKFSKC